MRNGIDASDSGDGMHLLPVIVISGHGKEPQDIIGAFRDGIDDFILKPLGTHGQDIGSQIHGCLERAGRSDHAACGSSTRDAANGQAAQPAGNGCFSHSPDYSQVSLNGQIYLFTGEIQRSVIGILHAAAGVGRPWLIGKILLKDAGSNDVSMRMANLFRRHPAWGPVIQSNGRGQYRLRTE